MDVQRELVDLQVLVDAQDPRDDAPLRMVAGLLRRQPALPDHPLHQRVVLGQLLQGGVPVEVRPRVAHVDHVRLGVFGQQRGHGGPHAPQRRVGVPSL
jgi:hypothetical protein